MKIRQTIEVEVNETVDADVYLGVDEIVRFINECSPFQKKQIYDALRDVSIETPAINLESLEGVMKMEALVALSKKYTSYQLEAFLNG